MSENLHQIHRDPKFCVFRYTVTCRGNPVEAASTLRGARRALRRHNKKDHGPKVHRKWWEFPVVHSEGFVERSDG